MSSFITSTLPSQPNGIPVPASPTLPSQPNGIPVPTSPSSSSPPEGISGPPSVDLAHGLRPPLSLPIGAQVNEQVQTEFAKYQKDAGGAVSSGPNPP